MKDLRVAESFYDKLLPLLGFNIDTKGEAVFEAHDFRVIEYSHPRLGFAIGSPRSAFAGDAIHRRKPGALHHLAFKAASRAEVDKLHQGLVAIGANIVTPPRVHAEYVPAPYYALFFTDLEGLKYEIVCCGDAARD